MSDEIEALRTEMATAMGLALEAVMFAMAEVIRGLHDQGAVDRDRLADALEQSEARSLADPSPYKTMAIAALLERLRGQRGR